MPRGPGRSGAVLRRQAWHAVRIAAKPSCAFDRSPPYRGPRAQRQGCTSERPGAKPGSRWLPAWRPVAAAPLCWQLRQCSGCLCAQALALNPACFAVLARLCAAARGRPGRRGLAVWCCRPKCGERGAWHVELAPCGGRVCPSPHARHRQRACRPERDPDPQQRGCSRCRRLGLPHRPGTTGRAGQASSRRQRRAQGAAARRGARASVCSSQPAGAGAAGSAAAASLRLPAPPLRWAVQGGGQGAQEAVPEPR